MNNTPPTKSPDRAPQNQQRTAQGQQRPMQGQPRPAQSQQRPVQGQQQRPAQGQQRPMQNQQRPAQGQQRPAQGQQRPLKKEKSAAIPILSSLSTVLGGLSVIQTIIIIALIISVVFLLLCSLIIGCVAISNSDILDDLFNKKDNYVEQDDGGKEKPNKDTTQKVDESDPTIVNASITLPSATPNGSYVAANATDVKDISGITSNAAVLVDVSSGKVTASKNADTRIYPASMTKVMTLLVACEKGEVAGKLLTVEQWMVDYQQQMGASGNLAFKAGEQISLENALYLINYRSDTIACLMVAKYIAGSEEAFVELMNQKARDLGLTGTHFTNTTGLHDPNHYTTCREMAAIMSCAMKNPVASKIISSYNGRGISIYVDNKVSRSATIYAAWYSDSTRFADNPKVYGTNGNMTVIGGKTGYEDIPTACFVTIAEQKNGARYICVTVGRTAENQGGVSAKQSTTDTETIYRVYAYK